MTLDEYRRASGLTLEQLADRLGVNGIHAVRTVSRYVRMERRIPTDVALRIKDATEGKVTLADIRPDLAAVVQHASAPVPA